ncbi:MAG: flagellar biosynthesis anti-sigma factor FlgM [Nitrospirota bacterium]
MKIYGNMPNGQEINRIAQNNGNPEPVEKPVSAPAKIQSDTINISDKGKEVAELLSSINELPEVREQKIQEIQQALASGTYTVDPRKIAQKMLNEL